MRSAKWFSVLSFALGAGCLFPSLGELAGPSAIADGGPDSPTINDAANDTSIVKDAAIDQSASDTSTTDAFVADAAASPCVGTFLFCDDFDSVSVDPFGFQGSYSSGSGTAAINQVDFVSKPSSFEVVTGMTSTPGGAQYALKEISAGTFTGATVEFDVRVNLPSMAGLGPAESILFRFDPNAVNALELAWTVGPSSTWISNDVLQASTSYSGTNVTLPALVAKTWKHVAIVAKLGSPPTLTVQYDGVQVYSAALHFMNEKYPLKFDPDIEINAGIFYLDQASAPWHLELDNFIVK